MNHSKKPPVDYRFLQVIAPVLQMGCLPEDAGKEEIQRWRKNVRGEMNHLCNGGLPKKSSVRKALNTLRSLLHREILPIDETLEAASDVGLAGAVSQANVVSAWFDFYRVASTSKREEIRDALGEDRTLQEVIFATAMRIPRLRHPELTRMFEPAFLTDLLGNVRTTSRGHEDPIDLVGLVNGVYRRISGYDFGQIRDLTPQTLADTSTINLAIKEALGYIRLFGYKGETTEMRLQRHIKTAVLPGKASLLEEVERVIADQLKTSGDQVELSPAELKIWKMKNIRVKTKIAPGDHR